MRQRRSWAWEGGAEAKSNIIYTEAERRLKGEDTQVSRQEVVRRR